MGKKGIASIFSKLIDSPSAAAAAAADSPSAPWPWPSCRNNPQTTSSREDYQRPCTTAGITIRGPAAARCRKAPGEMYKTVNSVYFDYTADDSCFGDDNEEGQLGVLDDDSFSTTTASEEWSEAVIRSLGRTSTDRFFFDPGPASNSILAAASPPPGKSTPAAAKAAVLSNDGKLQDPSTSLVEESVAVALDSEDPYRDFRASMEEMVAVHGLHGWEALEELLVWYLRINGKHNHAFIVGAFVDLLVGLSTSTSAAATTTTTTSSSSSSSSSSASTPSTSTSSTTGGDVTATTATMEQCGGGKGFRGNDASCSSPSSGQEVEDRGGNEPSRLGSVRLGLVASRARLGSALRRAQKTGSAWLGLGSRAGSLARRARTFSQKIKYLYNNSYICSE